MLTGWIISDWQSKSNNERINFDYKSPLFTQTFGKISQPLTFGGMMRFSGFNSVIWRTISILSATAAQVEI